MATKRLREEEEANPTMADRLTNLPESLQLRILSSLETKYAVQTSMLSKSWVSSWTCVPVLNFSSYRFNKLRDFDKFVFNTLSRRQSLKLDKLTFIRGGTCSAKILKTVFDYAISQGVKELEASIHYKRKGTCQPIWSITSSDSLKSLKLKSDHPMGLGPGLGSFQSLTCLHLQRAIISDLDPFSRFPALQKLILVNFHLQTDGNTLNVHAPQLLNLTISNYFQYVYRCELATPKLKYFEYQGRNFPQLKTKGGLLVLDTLVINYNGFCPKIQEKKVFDDLLMMFNSFGNARSLTVFSSVFHLLSLFSDELVNLCSPFGNLKCLKLDFSLFHNEKLFQGPCRSLVDMLKHVPVVKAYLLQKSQNAKCSMIYPDIPYAKSSCSNSHSAQKCVCLQSNTIKVASVRSWQK